MERSLGYLDTTRNLLQIGAKDLPTYLQTAFPAASDVTAAVVQEVDALNLEDNRADPDDMVDTLALADKQAKAIVEVPFYIKIRGKDKGKCVMYDTSKSSVSQIYELAAQLDLPNPVFNHTSAGAAHLPSFSVQVTFDGITATHTAFASSFKEGKELACNQLITQILLRNRTITHLTTT